jgi:hypothetical protein
MDTSSLRSCAENANGDATRPAIIASAKQTSAILLQLARALERSAELAEIHAHKSEQAGGGDDAAKKRQAARRTRDAAARARSQAANGSSRSESERPRHS